MPTPDAPPYPGLYPERPERVMTVWPWPQTPPITAEEFASIRALVREVLAVCDGAATGADDQCAGRINGALIQGAALAEAYLAAQRLRRFGAAWVEEETR